MTALPYLIAVPIDQGTRYPAAMLQTDDMEITVVALLSGQDSLAIAEEIARRCNNWKEPE